MARPLRVGGGGGGGKGAGMEEKKFKKKKIKLCCHLKIEIVLLYTTYWNMDISR